MVDDIKTNDPNGEWVKHVSGNGEARPEKNPVSEFDFKEATSALYMYLSTGSPPALKYLMQMMAEKPRIFTMKSTTGPSKGQTVLFCVIEEMLLDDEIRVDKRPLTDANAPFTAMHLENFLKMASDPEQNWMFGPAFVNQIINQQCTPHPLLNSPKGTCTVRHLMERGRTEGEEPVMNYVGVMEFKNVFEDHGFKSEVTLTPVESTWRPHAQRKQASNFID